MTVLRRAWFVVLLVGTSVGLQAVTALSPASYAPLRRAFGLSGPALMEGEIYRLVVSPLLQTRPGFVGTVWIVAIAIAPVVAWRIHPGRAAALFFIGDWAGSLMVLAVAGVAAQMGDAGANAHWNGQDVGSSSGVYSLVLGAALSLPHTLRVWSVAAIVAVFGYRVLVFGRMYDYQHAISLIAAAVVMAIPAPRWQVAGLRTRAA